MVEIVPLQGDKFYHVLLAMTLIANPTNIMANSQMSLREAALVATKQSRKVIRNGMLRRTMLLLAMTFAGEWH